MSYILQALEKSEQQRQQLQATPDAESADEQLPTSSRSNGVATVLLVSLVIISVCFVIYSFQKAEIAAIPAVESPLVASPVLVSPVVSEQEKISVQEQVPMVPSRGIETFDDKPEKMTSEEQSQAPKVIPRQDKSDPVSIHELKDDVLSRMPPIIVSSHIYSSVSEYRKVTINGESFIEGQALNGDLRLTGIGKEKLFFELNGKKFSVPALQGWQP